MAILVFVYAPGYSPCKLMEKIIPLKAEYRILTQLLCLYSFLASLAPREASATLASITLAEAPLS